MEPDFGAAMGYETWSSILKVVGYAGMALVLVSTVGLGFVTDQFDKIKDAKVDELVAGKNALMASVDNYRHQIEEKQKQLDDLKIKLRTLREEFQSLGSLMACLGK